jgi:hypothetical protein
VHSETGTVVVVVVIVLVVTLLVIIFCAPGMSVVCDGRERGAAWHRLALATAVSNPHNAHYQA